MEVSSEIADAVAEAVRDGLQALAAVTRMLAGNVGFGRRVGGAAAAVKSAQLAVAGFAVGAEGEGAEIEVVELPLVGKGWRL